MSITALNFRRRTAALVALGLLLIPAGALRAETRVGGEITGHQSWNKTGNPHIVTGDITIPKGSSLTVGPGVEIRFKRDINDRHGLNFFDLEVLVEGELIVNGAENDTVVFTSDSESPRWTDWQGLVIRGPDARAELNVTRVEYANEGIKVLDGELSGDHIMVHRCSQFGMYFIGARGTIRDALVTEIANPGGTAYGINFDRAADVTLENSFVVGAQNGIVYSRGSTGTLDKTVVTMCPGPGVIIHNSSPTLTRCTLTGNEYGIICSAGSVPVVHDNNIFENATANLWLKGYKDDKVEIDFTNNWWGVAELSLVEDTVDDAVDDPTEKGYAVVDPFLTEATSDAEGWGDQ